MNQKELKNKLYINDTQNIKFSEKKVNLDYLNIIINQKIQLKIKIITI